MENAAVKNLRTFQGFSFDGFSYTRDSVKDDTTYYKCVHYKKGMCKARGLKKIGEDFKVTINHLHERDEFSIKKKKFKQDLCRKSMTENTNYKEIYNSTRRQHPEAAVNVTFCSIESTMHKWRKKTLPILPPVPASVLEYATILNSPEYEEWKQFNGGNFSVSAVTDNAQSTSIIFIDVAFAQEIIADNNIVYCDATYKIVPKITDAFQFLTFIMLKFNHGFPIAYAIMESKTESAYECVIAEIRRVLPNLHITAFMTDFEVALQNAILNHFPDVESRRCFFHYTKCIYHFAVTNGLKRYITIHAEGRNAIKQLMALALLPPDMISATYEEIKWSKSAECRRRLTPLLQYFERQWLRIIRPEGFSVFGLQSRTNNVLESYHKVLNTFFPKHSTTWIFTKKLREFQENQLLDYKSLAEGRRITRREKAITTMRNEFLLRQWNDLGDGNPPTGLEVVNRILRFNADPINEYLNLFL